MDGHVFRRKGENLFEGIHEALGRIRRQAGYKVGVDAGETVFRGKLKGLLGLRGGVPPAYGLEYFILHGLRVYANSRDSRGAQRGELFGSDGIRPARLHGVFAKEGKIEETPPD